MKTIFFKLSKIKEELYHFPKNRLSYFYDKFHKHPEIQITYIEYTTGNYFGNWNFIKEHKEIQMNEVIRFISDKSERTITSKERAAEVFYRYFKLHTRKTFISFLK
ncbi:MAG: hypothetical protein EPN39_10145 [Chitinophagaceae bacterium]|nr:MAG: hypothetical protein EPN39_10145 [Chitinophagaceae bacterium]